MANKVIDNLAVRGTLKLVDTAITATGAELNILDGVTATAAELNILDGVTSTAAELNLLDGSAVANSVASVAAILDVNKKLANAANTGSVPANSVITSTHGDGFHHRSLITLTALSLGNSGNTAALATGGLVYTFPAGVIQVRGYHMSMGVTASDATHAAQADVEFGLGTTVASGAVSVLGGTAAFENIAIGDGALTAANGTATLKSGLPPVSPFALTIAAAGNHTVYLNVAATWLTGAGVSALTATGTIVLDWVLLA